jgi:hypothetical protein
LLLLIHSGAFLFRSSCRAGRLTIRPHLLAANG